MYACKSMAETVITLSLIHLTLVHLIYDALCTAATLPPPECSF